MHNIKFLDFDEFVSKTKELEGGHWSPETIAIRWDYYDRVINLIKGLKLNDASKVLEMGTMGIPCIRNGHTIDYAERWDFPGKKPTYLHDARKFPWPIENKSYELFIALRVYQHLVPVQKECVREAMRIAKKIIIVVPREYNNEVLPDSKPITYRNFVNYLDQIHPNLFTVTSMGDLYYWDTENPSYLDIEGVMQPTVKSYHNTETQRLQGDQNLLSKIKRRIKQFVK